MQCQEEEALLRNALSLQDTARASRLQDVRDIKGLCLAFSFASACLFYFFEMARRARSSERSSGAAVWLWGFVG